MILTIFVVIIHDMYLRTVKVRSSSGSINEYVRVVEAYRDNGKVKQRTLADLGRKDLLVCRQPSIDGLTSGSHIRARKSISVTNEVGVELYHQAQYNQCVTLIDYG